jgi:hypothetical protein
MTMARALQLEPGWYRHTTLSLHLYETNVNAANALIAHYDANGTNLTHEAYRSVSQPLGIGVDGISFNQIMLRARMIIHNEPFINEQAPETPSERWYRGQLHPTTPNVG